MQPLSPSTEAIGPGITFPNPTGTVLPSPFQASSDPDLSEQVSASNLLVSRSLSHRKEVGPAGKCR